MTELGKSYLAQTPRNVTRAKEYLEKMSDIALPPKWRFRLRKKIVSDLRKKVNEYEERIENLLKPGNEDTERLYDARAKRTLATKLLNKGRVNPNKFAESLREEDEHYDYLTLERAAISIMVYVNPESQSAHFS